MKGKGIIGEVIIKDGQLKGYDGDVQNPEEISKIVKENMEKGMSEARDLGFTALHGFAMIGSERSLTFMKDRAVIVKTREVSWEDLFLGYVYSKSILILGILVTLLGIGILTTSIAGIFPFFSLNADIYFSIASLVVGIALLVASKSQLSYRL